MEKAVKITVAIPSCNSEKTIRQSIISAKRQSYPHKEILICDDGSTDGTIKIAESLEGTRVIKNEKNIGIGRTLERLMNEAKGKYIVYLCADDLFADSNVVGDIVAQFDKGDPKIGIIGRQYYEFMDGIPGAVGTFRERKNIILSSCNPSGMAFRVIKDMESTNKIFIEMPTLVRNYLKDGWLWTIFEYDSIAVRIHPGPSGNTGTKKEYYTQSMHENWWTLVPDFIYYPAFIQIKARAGFKMAWREIWLVLSNRKESVRCKSFWLNAVIAVALPAFILRVLSKLYRNRHGRKTSKIMGRKNE